MTGPKTSSTTDITEAARKAYNAWRDYFDADERDAYWGPLVIEMGRLGSIVNGRDMTEPNDPEPWR